MFDCSYSVLDEAAIFVVKLIDWNAFRNLKPAPVYMEFCIYEETSFHITLQNGLKISGMWPIT